MNLADIRISTEYRVRGDAPEPSEAERRYFDEVLAQAVRRQINDMEALLGYPVPFSGVTIEGKAEEVGGPPKALPPP